MDYNKAGQPVQAYPVQSGQQYPPAQEAYPTQQPYGNQQPYGQQLAGGATVVAQPYNGPTAQQAVVGQAGNQQQHVVIVRQGHGDPAAAGQIPPSNHCCIAWLSCLFCCCPIGLFAIFLSSSVNSKWRSGDFDGAYRASELAKKASIAAIIIGLIWQIAVSVVETSAVEDDDGTSNDVNPRW
ncbi:unnamed protein product [Scytosiphon promiscuus]